MILAALTIVIDMPELIEAVKRGLNGWGLPIVFPTISLGGPSLSTSMMYRNLMSMDTEEMINAQPMDAAVLIGVEKPCCTATGSC